MTFINHYQPAIAYAKNPAKGGSPQDQAAEELIDVPWDSLVTQWSELVNHGQ